MALQSGREFSTQGAVATIKDVARAVGVSAATIHRALTRPDLVRPHTRQRVLEAVERLGYAPNSAAASLRTARTGKIVVTVPDISNAFFGTVIRGVEEAAQEAGYAVLLGDTRDEIAREDQYAAMLFSREADGLIFLGHRLPAPLHDPSRRGKAPAPIVNGCEFAPSLNVPSAHIDNAAAAGLAMDTLYDAGHRDVAIVTGPLASPLSRDRLTGARAVAIRRGLADRLRVWHGDFSPESGRRCAGEMLGSTLRPTAIFCFNDEMAIGALAALRAAALACPDDVSVIGFDDIAMARYAAPPLTTIRQPAHEIGRQTVGLLLAMLAEPTAAPASVTLPHRLIVRQSVGAPPAR